MTLQLYIRITHGIISDCRPQLSAYRQFQIGDSVFAADIHEHWETFLNRRSRVLAQLNDHNALVASKSPCRLAPYLCTLSQAYFITLVDRPEEMLSLDDLA